MEHIPLHSELLKYKERLNETFMMVKHPLVFSVPYHDDPMINNHMNKQLEFKTEHVAKCLKEKKFHSYVFLHERPYRLQAFSEICHDISDSQYWELLSNVYIDCENIFQNFVLWQVFLSSPRKYRHKLMNAKERHFLAKLPETLTIYRGLSNSCQPVKGVSWTLKQERAKWFANRYNPDNPKVYQAQTDRINTLAYLNGRNEDEIVVLPKFLRNVSKVS